MRARRGALVVALLVACYVDDPVEVPEAERPAPRPAPQIYALAFNVARAAEMMGDCCAARAYYDRFIAHESGHTREEAEQRLAGLACDDCPP